MISDAVRVPGPMPPIYAEFSLGSVAAPSFVRVCRVAAAAAMASWRLPQDFIDAPALIVLSELMTNAVAVADGEQVELHVAHTPDGLVVAVWDPVPVLPPTSPKCPVTDAEEGRGLFLVEILSCGDWDITPSSDRPGKFVTARMKVAGTDQVVAVFNETRDSTGADLDSSAVSTADFAAQEAEPTS